MVKYIYLFLILLIYNSNLKGNSSWSVGEQKIDSIYNTLSLEQKLRALLIVPSVYNGIHNNTEKPEWVSIEKLLSIEGEYAPMLSDMMKSSAFLGRDNAELQQQYLNILLRKNYDGVYFPIQSPYSLLFQNDKNGSFDFFLEPIGRIVLPYWGADSTMGCFKTNLYKLPKKILSQHAVKFSNVSDSEESSIDYMKGTSWKELQNIMKEYENPSLELLLKYGGLIYSDDEEKDYNVLKRVFEKNLLPINTLKKSCKKRILIEELLKNKPEAKVCHSLNIEVNNLVRNLYKKGAVLLHNEPIIPLGNLESRTIASIHIGEEDVSNFQQTLSKYASVHHFNVEKVQNADMLSKVKKETLNYNTIVVGVNGDWLEEDINSSIYSFLHQVSSTAELILVHFGSGNRLEQLPDKHPFKAILLSFEPNEMAQDIAAQIIFGGIAANGILPKSINGKFKFGMGAFTEKCRLGYAPSYECTMSDTLKLIDQIVYKSIRERATPGCQVLVAKEGNVIYNKSFGYHTYNKKRHVEKSDLYDIASVTKIVSAVPLVMRLYDEEKIKLTDSISVYLPRLKNTNKSGLKLDDMLIHQAGLQSWIPFYNRAVDKDKLKGDIYSRRYSSQYNIKLDKTLYMNKSARYRTDIFKHSKNDDFNVKVCAGLYMNKSFLDSMKLGIDTSKVEENASYRYSDLGYYYLKEIIEKKYNQPLNEKVENDFYKRLGAKRMLYKPLEKYNKREIIPTEYDKAFRKELIHGYVHDPGAAMLGGIGGHAGVFASAEDLVKILQMYLNGGAYGGETYIDSATIKRFTSIVKEGNRRGLGFDKPVLDPEISGPTCKEASPSSYGHSGFTGTLVWIDPEYDLVYIFLSNRIHPNQYNKRLIKTDVRTKIQSAIYRSLPEYWEKRKASLSAD